MFAAGAGNERLQAFATTPGKLPGFVVSLLLN